MNVKKVVITGGPSTGKTSLVRALQNAGYFCYPEVIRQMTIEAKNKGALSNYNENPIASVSNPLDFNKKILTARLSHYQDSLKQDKPVVFFDRGMPDVLAYMDYYDQPHPEEFMSIVKHHSYDLVFMLPMWQDIFVQDGERFENYEDAVKINECLYETYGQLGKDIMTVPKSSVTERVEFVLQNLNR